MQLISSVRSISFYPKLSVRRQSHFLPVVVFLILAGCATPIKVETDYDPLKDFSAFRKYAWYDRVSAPNRVVENRVRKAVDTVLHRRGFRYAESGSEADFRVSFTAVAEPTLRVDEVSTRLAYGHGTWSAPFTSRTPVQEYTRGTLIVDIIEPAEGGLLWRGVSSRSLDEDRRQSEKAEDILEIVRAILQQFPPKPQE